jgi:hypothetical protein
MGVGSQAYRDLVTALCALRISCAVVSAEES